MNTPGSQQLRQFRIAIRDGASIEDAAALVGMTLTEARLTVKADEADPPPPEAYELLGHNKGPAMAEVNDDHLRLLIERVERLEEEKAGIAEDIREVYAEAKAVGYDAKIMRQIVRLRKMAPDDRREMQAILDTYLAALGMDYAETPLGRATIERAVPSTAEDGKELYPAALQLVIEHQKASVSWLQRQLRIGYNSAARLIEKMEAHGIVGAPNHVGVREILVADADAALMKAMAAPIVTREMAH